MMDMMVAAQGALDGANSLGCAAHNVAAGKSFAANVQARAADLIGSAATGRPLGGRAAQTLGYPSLRAKGSRVADRPITP